MHYYAGLLSRAQYYGAARHRPQEFQIVLERNRPAVTCGSVEVTFAARCSAATVSVQLFDNPGGMNLVSTVQATTVDPAGYMHRVDGVSRIAGVPSQIHKDMEPEYLVEPSKAASIVWAQHPGYLLEHVNAGDKAVQLTGHVRHHVRNFTKLLPGAIASAAPRSTDWRFCIHAGIQAAA